MSQKLLKPPKNRSFMRKLSLLPVLMLLASCGGGDSSLTAKLTGQVSALFSNSGTKTTHFAASRFLEQASMGPSPASVAQVRAQGIDAWVAAQMKMAPTTIVTPASLYEYELNVDIAAQQRLNDFWSLNLYNLLIGGEDQLRIRTSWVLSNFLVFSTRKVLTYGAIEYLNRRTQLNENYGRELMQLFTVGLVQLNLNGTPKRDANGKLLETYSQKDVIEITRALTGWNFADPNTKRKSSNNLNYGKPMEATWPDRHDTDSKTFLGKTIPAGQNAEQDLDSLVEILMSHPNTAPFVSLRLIQGMTASDPSPAYLERVATVFMQTKGNLAQVITAVLTDPEARYADAPNKSTATFGRIKEPLLIHTSGFRGMGCKVAVREEYDPTRVLESYNQQPLNAYSVFNFYPPNHKTQGTNVLAPEQKMLNATEFSGRMSFFKYKLRDETLLSNAGCDVAAFKSAAAISDENLVNLMNDRYFRGALPAAISKSLVDAHKNYWERDKGLSLMGSMLDMAAITPVYGVTK